MTDLPPLPTTPCGYPYCGGNSPECGKCKRASPVAWIDDSGHPRHMSYMQGVRERQLYGPLRPIFDQSTIDEAIAAERERHRLEVHSCGPTCTMVGCVNARLRADFARECSDTDELLRMLCLDPQDMRTDGGSLNLAKVRELIVDLVSAEREMCAKHIDVPWSRPGSDFAAAIRAKA